VIQVEPQKEALTPQELFSIEVDAAINRAMNQLEETFDSVNLDFENEVTLSASKHAMSGGKSRKCSPTVPASGRKSFMGRETSLMPYRLRTTTCSARITLPESSNES